MFSTKTFLFLLCLEGIFSLPMAGGMAAEKAAEPTSPGFSVGGTVQGLAGPLLLQLNDREERHLTGDGRFTFDGQYPAGEGYQVEIKRAAANHRCEVINGQGLIDAETAGKVEVLCRQTGKWSYPDSLADNISLKGQDAAAPVTVTDSKGNALVAWSQSDGSHQRIFISEYRQNKWLHPAAIQDALSPEGSDAMNPRVAMADNGDRVVVWDQKPKNKERFIMMAENRQGKWRKPPSLDQHISPGDSYAWEADVAMDNGGNTIVVWDQEGVNRNYLVYKSEYRNGVWRHPASRQDSLTAPFSSGDASRPRVAMNNRGEALITWAQDPGGRSAVYLSEYRQGAWSLPAEAEVFSLRTENSSAFSPNPAMDDQGRAVIAWVQASPTGVGVFAREYLDGSWRPPQTLTEAISPAAFNSAEFNSLALDNHGHGLVLWTMAKMGKQSLFKSELSGGIWSKPGEKDFLRGGEVNDRRFGIFGKVAIADTGKMVIIWWEISEERPGRIFMAESDQGLWYLPAKELTIPPGPASEFDVAATEDGDFLLFWRQNDGNFTQIYKSEFHPVRK